MNHANSDLISLSPQLSPGESATNPGPSPEDPVCVHPWQPPGDARHLRGPWAKDASHSVSTEAKHYFIPFLSTYYVQDAMQIAETMELKVRWPAGGGRKEGKLGTENAGI